MLLAGLEQYRWGGGKGEIVWLSAVNVGRRASF